MKRRTIALLVACAVLVLCVVVVWGNWKALAYRNCATGYLRAFGHEYTALEKRWSFLPGPPSWVPDQLCYGCLPQPPGSHQHIRVWGNLEMTEARDLPDFEAVIGRLNTAPPRCICQQCFPGRKAR